MNSVHAPRLYITFILIAKPETGFLMESITAFLDQWLSFALIKDWSVTSISLLNEEGQNLSSYLHNK